MSTPARTVHTSNSGAGIGCLGVAALMTIVLGILKLAGTIELSWLLAFAPVIVVVGLGGVALLTLLIILGIIAVVLAIAGKRGRR